MSFQDFLILVIYGGGMLAIGAVLSKRNKTAVDMFAVNRQSPWWLAGLSAFMSAFSSGTFVVWGGIAFKHGAVAISILLCSGIASLFVGRYIAGVWAGLGVKSVSEFIDMRFGKQATMFYTWAGMIFKVIAMAVALYSFSTLVAAIIDVPEGYFFRNDATGKISITYACIISGILMLSYAVSGGLWAVLIIDAVQFIVLTASVLFVVPLCFAYIGGVSQFVAKAPDGFLSPVSGTFSYSFLLCWVIVHFFKLGGEWVFIQRFLAVKDTTDAKKSTYFLGVLFIVCPVFWMLPPMVYRLVDSSANPEFSYFLMCTTVLPAGMIGLLVAAMFSSTASYIDGEVNVYAGALTRDLYARYLKPNPSAKSEVMAGRIFSALIGGAIIGLAVFIPRFGGAESVILTVTSLLAVSMVLPPIWGLFFGKIKQDAVWYCSGITLAVAILLKFSVPEHAMGNFWVSFKNNQQLIEVAVGICVPLLILLILELREKDVHPGFRRIRNSEKRTVELPAVLDASIFPGKILALSVCLLGVLMIVLAIFSESSALLMIVFGSVFLLLSALIFFGIKKAESVNVKEMTK